MGLTLNIQLHNNKRTSKMDDKKEAQRKKIEEAGNIYTPSYPIELIDLFSGRKSQLNRITETMALKGHHAIVYGDRGVGKTSFANIVKLFHKSPERQVIKISCDSNDTFASLWGRHC